MTSIKRKLLKSTSVVLAVIMMLSVLAITPFTANAATIKSETMMSAVSDSNATGSSVYQNSSGEFEYELVDDEIMITGYTGNATTISIPSQINGHNVSGIYQYVFKNNKTVQTVKIPNSVYAIGAYAFYGCSALKNISMPNDAIVVGESILFDTAYYNNSANWSENVLYAGKYALKVKDNVTSASLKQGTICIAAMTAAYSNKLTTFTIPDSVKYINSLAIFECLKLKSVTVPYDTLYMGECAIGFYGPQDYNDTIHKYEDFRVVGARGTVAEEYANHYGFAFTNNTTAKSVKISNTSITLGVGETFTLTKAVSPSSASKVSWNSNNTGVATVNGSGKVTAKKAGTATVRVTTSSGMYATCKVTVKPAPSSVKINPSSLNLGKGEDYIISESTNSGSWAYNFTWSSSNTNVATVAKTSGNKAKVVAKGEGTATITIKTFNGKTSTCKITVKPAPTSATLAKSSLTMGKGEQLIITENTNSGSWATNFRWSSSNTNILTVTKTTGNRANIVAKGVGTATITFKTYNGKTATCKVTVKNAPSSVSLQAKNITVGVGESYDFNSTVNGDSASYKRSYSSSNTSVATVNSGGVITTKKPGMANITVKTFNGKTATCKVTVKSAPKSVKLGATSLSMGNGEKVIITESTNSGSWASGFTWSSSDTSVATVKKNNRQQG